jgi:undecaprenyl-diphosphatase
MTLPQAILLGIVQGITEFLPISSSAHLVLTPYLLGWNLPQEQVFAFDVLVQMGTLAAVLVYFWGDLCAIGQAFFQSMLGKRPKDDPYTHLGWLLILASIPAGLFGLLFNDTVEAAFNSPMATAVFLIVTAILLFSAEKTGRRTRSSRDLNWKDALIIGCFQLLSLFPGISRSGSTITGGMVRHLKRPAAARFSFLMSVPIMLAAGLFSSLELLAAPNWTAFLLPLLVGLITSAVVGYLAIRWLLAYLSRRPLYIFAFYVIGLGLITWIKLVYNQG